VDQPAEQIKPTDTIKIKIDDVRHCLVVAWWPLAQRRSLPECPVRSVPVVVPRVGLDHDFEITATGDQQPIQVLAADAANPALGVCPFLRRPSRPSTISSRQPTPSGIRKRVMRTLVSGR
jgi:hypothetical protein